MDMRGSYSSAVKEYLPTLAIVFDRYHITALTDKAIETLRREQQRTVDDTEKKALKGCRFLLLLKTTSFFAENHQTKLDTLLKINKPLFAMHSMKEQLRLLWTQPNHKLATAFLEQWCLDALAAGPKPLVKVGLTLLKQ